MAAVDLVGLSPLLQRTAGDPAVSIALIDGPVLTADPQLNAATLRPLSSNTPIACTRNDSPACSHGTFVAGLLNARRSARIPGICPDCTLLIRPVFAEPLGNDPAAIATTPRELASAINDCIHAGARCINLSLALATPASTTERDLETALDHAARRGVLVVAAGGNQGTLGSTSITRSPAVIPVVACTSAGIPMNDSNLAFSIARHGVCAPGESIAGIGTNGQSATFSGSSVAAPFVTGTIALLWSLFPNATAPVLKTALTRAYKPRSRSIVPPLLNAWEAFQYLQAALLRRSA
ncbi:MAG TPA: S8 family serine peptidase [Phycisphaerae bacterium]|nr:S8 family serine peptidase [Phycisphaerae bacterium]